MFKVLINKQTKRQGGMVQKIFGFKIKVQFWLLTMFELDLYADVVSHHILSYSFLTYEIRKSILHGCYEIPMTAHLQMLYTLLINNINLNDLLLSLIDQ